MVRALRPPYSQAPGAAPIQRLPFRRSLDRRMLAYRKEDRLQSSHHVFTNYPRTKTKATEPPRITLMRRIGFMDADKLRRLHEHIDRANRIALADPIIKAFRKQRRLLAIRPLNETLHHSPRRFSKRIIASLGFSHSLGQNRISSLRGYVFRFAPESGHRALRSACLFRAKERTRSRGRTLRRGRAYCIYRSNHLIEHG
jgi:hypothetical protein